MVLIYMDIFARLDRETEELRHERVSLDLGKLIMKGRNDKVTSNNFFELNHDLDQL